MINQGTVLNVFKPILKKHIVNLKRKLLIVYKYMCADLNVDGDYKW